MPSGGGTIVGAALVSTTFFEGGAARGALGAAVAGAVAAIAGAAAAIDGVAAGDSAARDEDCLADFTRDCRIADGLQSCSSPAAPSPSVKSSARLHSLFVTIESDGNFSSFRNKAGTTESSKFQAMRSDLANASPSSSFST